MKRRKYSATYVYTGLGPPLKNGIVEVDENGVVVAVIDTGGQLAELSNMEFHSGVLVAGFVNAHCHLELSHLREKVERKTGLADFVGQVATAVRPSTHKVERAMRNADADMYQQGVAAVGDISNSTDSLPVKLKSKIAYHTFVEVFGLNQDRATEIFDRFWHTKVAFTEKQQQVSLTPHAPYSLSPKLFEQLTDFIRLDDKPISFHNQETASENEWYMHGKGHLRDTLEKKGFPVDNIEATGKSSICSLIDKFPKKNSLLLVHNTFASAKDVEYVHKTHKNTFWVLCPNANLYIEDSLPNVYMLRDNNAQIALGTDSLASNYQLSILEEMLAIREYFPDIPFDEMLNWATINGAKALQMDKELGTIEKGKKPGLVLIQGFDYEEMHVTDKSFSRRII